MEGRAVTEGRESYIWASEKQKAPSSKHTGIPEKDQRLTNLHSKPEKNNPHFSISDSTNLKMGQGHQR